MVDQEPRHGNHAALRVLILNGDLPFFPGRAGNEYLQTTRLARRAEKVGLCSLVHQREQQERKAVLAQAGIELYLWENPLLSADAAPAPPRPALIRQAGRVVYDLLRTRLRPHDTLLQDLQFRNLSGPILQALNQARWQALVVVQSNCARWLDYLPGFPASVLVLHDVRALVYERRARSVASPLRRLSCAIEAWRYRYFEGRYCQKYDLVLTVSSADEAWVRQHYRPSRLMTIPLPVDGDYFAPLPGVREAPNRILFTGMMDHPPNVDAACFFAREVLPQVQRAVPEAEFWIVGREPPPEVRALGGLPGVVVTGLVSDIRPFIAQATVVVVPLRFGSGMRNKILEAWAMEKCVVSTRIGAEGLDYQDGVNILIADGADELAARVADCLRDPGLRERLRGQGRALATTLHHPDRLADEYYQALARTVQRKRAQAGPVHTLIDLRWMRPGVAGGIENLSRSFLNELRRFDRTNRYTVLAPAEVRYDFDLRQSPNLRVAVDESPRRCLRQLAWQVMAGLHRRLHIDYWRSPEVETLRRARELGAEVALSIPGYIRPDLYPLANVLVVPDIQHEYCPQFFTPEELAERRRLYTDSIRRADHICAISEFTRQTLIERLGTPPDRVTTTYPAPDPLFHPQNAHLRDDSHVCAKYGLPGGEYLLFPANTWPHKNHHGALAALRILREQYHQDPLLVCTGSAKGAQPELLKAIHDLGLDGRVRFLGYCPTPDMPGLYRNAAALVFPSFFEGFGIPLLEAMWCDCPIVCSNVTSLPELAGDAALLVDPHSPEELAAALARVLGDRTLRNRLTAAGRHQVTRFSWPRFTRQITRILYEVREMRYG